MSVKSTTVQVPGPVNMAMGKVAKACTAQKGHKLDRWVVAKDGPRVGETKCMKCGAEARVEVRNGGGKSVAFASGPAISEECTVGIVVGPAAQAAPESLLNEAAGMLQGTWIEGALSEAATAMGAGNKDEAVRLLCGAVLEMATRISQVEGAAAKARMVRKTMVRKSEAPKRRSARLVRKAGSKIVVDYAERQAAIADMKAVGAGRGRVSKNEDGSYSGWLNQDELDSLSGKVRGLVRK